MLYYLRKEKNHKRFGIGFCREREREREALNAASCPHCVNRYLPSRVFSFLLILSLLFISFVLGNIEGGERDCLMMDDSKRAAKAFVDQYFPLKEPNPKPSDVLGDLFPPNSKKESPKKQGGFGGQSLNAQSAVADGKFQGSSAQKNQSTPQKGSNAAEHCEISEPCLMSSSVDYGCRDNYPYNPDNRYPGPSYYIEGRKDGSEYANPEIGGGAEWWQGSYYY